MSVSNIAVSGMEAASLRLQISASNVANAGSDGPLADAVDAGAYPAAYAPLRVDQTESASGGTLAMVRRVSPSSMPMFGPTAAYADSDGMVASPNIDLAGEIVQQLMARTAFEANAKLLNVDARMTKALLDITA